MKAYCGTDKEANNTSYSAQLFAEKNIALYIYS